MPDPNLGALRAEYKGLVGKNPSPKLDAAGLQAKIDELKAAAAAAPAPAGADAGAPGADAAAPAKGDDKADAKADAKADDKAEAKAEVDIEAPEGTVWLEHPEKIGCSYRGVELKPNKKGHILAPASAVEELTAHGFKAL